MAFQDDNVDIYNWILEELGKQDNKTMNFINLRSNTQRRFGIADDKFNKAISILETSFPPEIKRTKEGDDVLITKL